MMLYSLGKWSGQSLLRTTKRLTYHGLHHVPATGPVIVAANHKSNFDPFVVGGVTERQVRFLAKDELFTNPVLGWLMGHWGAIRLKRGSSDRAAITAALSVLDDHEVVGIFVEGGRQEGSKVLGDFRAGAAMLSHRSKAPIVPVGIRHADRSVSVHVGPPISPESLEANLGESASRKAIYAEINDRLAAALLELISGDDGKTS